MYMYSTCNFFNNYELMIAIATFDVHGYYNRVLIKEGFRGFTVLIKACTKLDCVCVNKSPIIAGIFERIRIWQISNFFLWLANFNLANW